MSRAPAVDRFFAKVKRGRGCWEFIGSRQRKGYGTFFLNGKTELAHRAAWMMSKGPINAGLHILHKCDNPPCVRLDHLFLGTNLDNAMDCKAKGRRHGNIGSANGTARLTEAAVRRIRRIHIKGRSGPGSPSNLKHLANLYGVTKTTIANAAKGKTWRHVK